MFLKLNRTVIDEFIIHFYYFYYRIKIDLILGEDSSREGIPVRTWFPWFPCMQHYVYVCVLVHIYMYLSFLELPCPLEWQCAPPHQTTLIGS